MHSYYYQISKEALDQFAKDNKVGIHFAKKLLMDEIYECGGLLGTCLGIKVV